MNSERYARHVKTLSLQKKKKAQSPASMRKKALRDVTGVTEEVPAVAPDSSEECKASFENRKQEVQRKLSEDPLCFSSIILGEKTLL